MQVYVDSETIAQQLAGDSENCFDLLVCLADSFEDVAAVEAFAEGMAAQWHDGSRRAQTVLPFLQLLTAALEAHEADLRASA